ncbi:hypothetical protein D915_002006 [Fasciola hepatica]|uniref:Uncharacterized protein n=1 Tax=Fasciola hepatica TaxID=6192 RepID=A0A4E0RK77_FASHE|nr:hypothetical protein D915_002006 [Fasciola hepatica]
MPAVSLQRNNQTFSLEPFQPDEKFPLKLGVILLASCIILLFVVLICLICRRLRRYARLLGEKDDDEDDDGFDEVEKLNLNNLDDQEITQFDMETLRLAKAEYEQKSHRQPLATTVPPSSSKSSIRRTFSRKEGTNASSKTLADVPLSAFSIGDENDNDDDDGDSIHGKSVQGGLNPNNCYPKPEPIQIVTKAVPVQQPIHEVEPDVQHTEVTVSETTKTVAKLNEHEIEEIVSQLEQPQAIPVPKSTVRRVSSTPNIQLPNSEVFGIPAKPGSARSEKSTLTGLDDAELFEECAEDDELGLYDNDGTGFTNSTTVADSTLISGSRGNVAASTDSIADMGATRPLLPLKLPDWALQSGQVERGFLVFSMRINRKPGGGSNWFLMDLCIREARCILSHHTEARAGKFYVKARIQPTGMRQMQSIVSLNQLHTRGPQQHCSFVPEKLHAFGLGRSGVGISAGRTPIRRAFRSPVFWHAITLEIPISLSESCSSGHVTTQHYGSPLSCAVRNPARTQLELRLDLKEQNALPTDGLYSSSPSLTLLPPWKNSQVLGSVRIPLTQRIWDYFLHNSEEVLTPDETLSNQATADRSETPGSGGETAVELKPRVLRFVRRLEVPFQEAEARGDLTIGLQYNPETARLTLNPLKCSGVVFPKGTKNIFLRAALISNRKLIASQQSNPSARLTLNAAEFLLGERLQFVVEEHLSQVCLLLSVFARSTGKLQDSITLLGRCVTGPNGLAYGEGLAHWQAIVIRRSMVKRTHVLF